MNQQPAPIWVPPPPHIRRRYQPAGFTGTVSTTPLVDLAHITVTPPVDETELADWTARVEYWKKYIPRGGSPYKGMPLIVLTIEMSEGAEWQMPGDCFPRERADVLLHAYRDLEWPTVRTKKYWPSAARMRPPWHLPDLLRIHGPYWWQHV